MGNKHLVEPKDAPRDNLEDNPGIGSTKGTHIADEEPLTEEGADIEETEDGDPLNRPGNTE